MSQAHPLWIPSPDRIRHANLTRFLQYIEKKGSLPINPHDSSLYDWSIAEPERFWESLWDFLEFRHSARWDSVTATGRQMFDTRWFPGAKLNFAENLLRHRDDTPALIFRGEASVRTVTSFGELYDQVSALVAALIDFGVKPGDRVAAALPNMPAAIVGMLATTAIGALWSSCSPDFGVDGIVDRFGQINPKVLLSCDGYYFKGSAIDCTARTAEVLKRLPSVEHLIEVRYTGAGTTDAGSIPRHQFEDIVRRAATGLNFEQLPADHPIVIMFSSGTTGKPKCIVHGAVGTLIEQRKELELHSDLKRGDVIFYQTTCGWMMWNWLASSLASGATLLLYDGAPFHEEGRILYRIASEEGVTIFGTNAKSLSLWEKSGVKPGSEFNLQKIKTILSTGSVLAPESFDYVYREFASDILLSSISGGTDILGCFALGSPLLPVYRGALQTRSLGLAVEVFNAQGKSVTDEVGELVCTRPFPSMPVGFWGDADRSRYRKAYFERFPGVWTHGDFVELKRDGSMIFKGRSDATLNPGGVRIGSAELYHQVEKVPGVMESLAVARMNVGDEQIVLFVVLVDGTALDEKLEQQIRTVIRQNLTAFHVPRHIFAVTELPRTRSGKITELAVRDLLAGREIDNTEAIANPGCLAVFREIAVKLG